LVYHRVITDDPPNTGVGPEGLTGEPLNQRQMYVRCNLPLPRTVPEGFELVMPGQETRFINRERLESFRQVTQQIVLECAGNGRSLMSPAPEGTQWNLDGVSPITVSGYRLAEILGPLPEGVAEMVFTGADNGTVADGRQVSYQFSVSRQLAESTVPILATHIGGEPIDEIHGGPIRLIVPGHYAMKSVKWLIRVEGVTRPFRGHFVEKYRYFDDAIEPEGEPVAEIKVRSVISSPREGEAVPAGVSVISGSAWSGRSVIDRVDVSIDGGESWRQAELERRQAADRWAPVRWTCRADLGPGRLRVIARATDGSGATQPLESRWNSNGYGNNVVHRVTLDVVEA
jgi:DMSO/TMAO reductase YedYZ molybdopterin-dependent catalytic subunit